MSSRKPIFFRPGADYRAYITERNQGPVFTTFDSSAIAFNWERKKNLSTEASSVVNPECSSRAAANFRAQLADLEPWAHELHIERFGAEVWVGPVWRPSENIGESADLVARDMLSHLQVRAVHTLIDRTTATGLGPCDPVTFAGLLIRDALEPDDPGVLDLLTLFPSDASAIPQDRKVDPAQGDMTWENGLSPMLGSAIDISCVGRRIVVWQSGRCTGSADGFVGNNDIVAGFKVGRDGQAWASRVIVRGKDDPNNTAGTPVIGAWGKVDPRYGLVERRVSDDQTSTAVGAADSARTKLAAYGSAPQVQLGADNTTSASAGELDCSTDLDIGTLSCGACIPVDLSAGAFDAAGLYLVDGLEVSLGAAGEVASVLLVRPSELDTARLPITVKSNAQINGSPPPAANSPEPAPGTVTAPLPTIPVPSATPTPPAAPAGPVGANPGYVGYVANGTLPPPDPGGPGTRRLWVAGDSISAGYPPGEVGWPSLMHYHEAFNIARSGAFYEWPHGLQNYAGWTSSTFGGRIGDYIIVNVLRWGAPAQIVIMGGTNDLTAGTHIWHMCNMVQWLNDWLTQYGTKVTWVTAPPLNVRNADRQSFNGWLATRFPHVIQPEGFLANTDGTWKSIYDLGDGVHPNGAGRQALADIIEPNL